MPATDKQFLEWLYQRLLCKYNAIIEAYDAGRAAQPTILPVPDQLAAHWNERSQPAATPGQCPTCHSIFSDRLVCGDPWHDAPSPRTEPVIPEEWQSWRRTAERLQAEVYAWENREAAVCPEDIGFEEVINSQRAEVQRLRAERDILREIVEDWGDPVEVDIAPRQVERLQQLRAKWEALAATKEEPKV